MERIRVKLIRWKPDSYFKMGNRDFYNLDLRLLDLDRLLPFETRIKVNTLGPYRSFDDIVALLDRAISEEWVGEYSEGVEGEIPSLRFMVIM